MQGLAATNSKKKMLFGAGLLALIIAAIIFAIYATNRADANQSSASTSIVEAKVTDIDMKMGDGAMEINGITSLVEPNTSSSDSEPGKTATSNSNVEVRINGTPVDVPENGTVHKEVVTEDGSASFNFSSRSSTSGDSRTRSSVKLDVDSEVRVRE